MDDAMLQVRVLAERAVQKNVPEFLITVRADMLQGMFHRLDQTPLLLRDYSDADLLHELLNRQMRRQNFPEAMRTLQQGV